MRRYVSESHGGEDSNCPIEGVEESVTLYEREGDGAEASQDEQITQRPFPVPQTVKKDMNILLEGVYRQRCF